MPLSTAKGGGQRFGGRKGQRQGKKEKARFGKAKAVTEGQREIIKGIGYGAKYDSIISCGYI